MKIYTLVGKSGTGKSYQAMNLCKELNIDGIIDDGLFIYKNRIVAGISAKRQATTIGAIKTALFATDDHVNQVNEKLKELKPESILILATSDRMIDKIIARLNLPAPDERKYIEDITTLEEREIADKQRNMMGKHVIPAPTFQLKRDFAGYFVDPLRIFRGIAIGGKAQFSERTVVRPTFSYMGQYYISERALGDIVTCAALESEGVAEVIRTIQNTAPEAFKISITILVKKNYEIWETAERYQKLIAEKIEVMTAFNIAEVDIDVRGLA